MIHVRKLWDDDNIVCQDLICNSWHLTVVEFDCSPDFHAWWLKWHGLMQWCGFLFGFCLYCSPLRRSNSPKKNFPAKCAKYWNVHIIKITASIITKFCTLIETTEYSLWVVLICSKEIQDGEWPLSWKKSKRKIAISLQWIDRFWWMYHSDVSRTRWSSQDNWTYWKIAISLQRIDWFFYEIWQHL